MSTYKFKIYERDGEGMKAIKRIRALADMTARIGVFDDGKKHGNMSLSEIAVIHEFGAGNIPQRSFLRSTFDANINKYYAFLADEMKKIIEGKSTPQKSLQRLALRIVADAQGRIVEGIEPKLSPRTIKARAIKLKKQQNDPNNKDKKLRDARGKFLSYSKSSFKPLFDTGQLIRAITYKLFLKGVGL